MPKDDYTLSNIEYSLGDMITSLNNVHSDLAAMFGGDQEKEELLTLSFTLASNAEILRNLVTDALNEKEIVGEEEIKALFKTGDTLRVIGDAVEKNEEGVLYLIRNGVELNDEGVYKIKNVMKDATTKNHWYLFEGDEPIILKGSIVEEDFELAD